MIKNAIVLSRLNSALRDFTPYRFITFLVLSGLLAGCSQPDARIAIEEIPKLTENRVVQQAYERCVTNTHQELVRDHSEMSDAVRAIMYSGAVQTCESAVVSICERSINTESCNIILDIYKS